FDRARVPDRLGDGGRDLDAQPAARRCHEALLGAEVVGDQGLVLACARGHLGNGEPGVGIRLQHLEAGLEDALASARGRAPGPGPGLRRCAHAAAASIAGLSPIAASFLDRAFIAYSKISLEW